MTANAREQLTEELQDLFAVKLALVLVPAEQALLSVGRKELANVIRKISGDISLDLAAILAAYTISHLT